MNIIEYGYYDFSSNYSELKENLIRAISLNPNSISVFPCYLSTAKRIIKNSCPLSAVIDYPFGLSCHESRLASTKNAIKSGAQIIELVAPNHPLCNKKYDKLQKDIVEQKKVCDKNNVELRYVLDYRTYNQYTIEKTSHIFYKNGIKTIYPSNNYLLDNIVDNLIASVTISKKVPINIIVNGNVWTDHHVDILLKNSKIYGYKSNNITLEKIVYKTMTFQ